MFEDTNTAYALDSNKIKPNSLDFILNRLIFSFNYFNNIFQIMFIDFSRISMTNLFKKRLGNLYILQRMKVGTEQVKCSFNQIPTLFKKIVMAKSFPKSINF